MDLFNILERTVMTVEVINEHANVVMEFEPFFIIQASVATTQVAFIAIFANKLCKITKIFEGGRSH